MSADFFPNARINPVYFPLSTIYFLAAGVVSGIAAKYHQYHLI